jgi:L-iditol 2-dehydrogenase
MQMAAPAARIVFFAGLPKHNPIMQFDANLLHYKELVVLGSYGATPRQYQIALDMLDRRREPLEKIVTSRRTLDQIAEGFAEIKAGTALKVVVVP